MQRWVKFARYLSDFGWTPVVVVPEGAAYPVEDASLSADVPDGMEVIRVPIWEPFDAAQRLLGAQATEVERLGASAKAGEEKDSVASRLAKWVRGNLFIPDARVGWVRPATKAIVRHLLEKPAAAIITTGPPHSVHLIGRNVQRTMAQRGQPIQWIADFRDPWSDIDYLDDFHLTSWARQQHKKLERQVVNACDRLLVTAWGAAAGLLDISATEVRKRPDVWWIPNGWDAQDLPSPFPEAQAPDPETFVLAHFGSLYASRDFPAVWTAVRDWNLAAATLTDRRKIQLHFWGNTAPEVQASLRLLLPEEDVVIHGNLPHKQAVAQMAKADALLLLHNDTASGRKCIPGKLFEYLAVGRPLLAVGPDPGDLAWIMREEMLRTSPGAPLHFHAPTDGNGLFQTLGRLVGTTFADAQLDPAMVGRYERRALTSDLALRLDELLASTPKVQMGNPERSPSVSP